MYRKEFDKLLSKTLPRGVLFWGDEALIEIYEKVYINKVKLKGASVLSFYFDEIDVGEITSLLESSSLFGGLEIVHIKTEERFAKSELSPLLDALKASQNYLLISFYPGKSKSYATQARAMATSFTQGLAEVRFLEPSHSERIALLNERAVELGLNITPMAIDEILGLQRNNLSLAMKELEKYCLLDSKIDVQDVRALGSSGAPLSIDELISCIFDVNKSILSSYESLIYQGVDELACAFRIEQYFYTLFLFFAQAKIDGRQDPMKILGYTPPQHIVNLYLSRSLKISQEKFEEIFFLLCSMRINMLNGDKSAFLSTIISIKNLL